MNRLLALLLGGSLCLATATGCSSSCESFCEYFIECFPEMYEDGQGVTSCDWESAEDTAMEDCVEACDDAYDGLSDNEAETTDACLDCLDEELDGSCGASKWLDAVNDDCGCGEDDDFEEFWEEFTQDAPDVECTLTSD